MLKLAEMYMDEYFEDDENYHEAVFWLKKAIDFGSVEALLSLANLYEQGLGVEKNYEIADELRKTAKDKLLPH